MHMLHHLSLSVANVELSATFYDRALAPLGYVRVWSDIRPGEKGQAVAEFHAAALAAGGTDNGPPGLRAHYGPDYYAAFVLDPDGHHLEAVCKSPV